MTMPLDPGSTLATASSTKTGSTLTAVVTGLGSMTIECARDITPAAGDVLICVKVGSKWYAIGRAFAAAPADPNPNPTPVNTGGSTGVLAVRPVETRSYRSIGWRKDNSDVYQGQYGGQGNHTGCVFFGAAPRSLAGATVQSCTVVVRRNNAGGITAPQPTSIFLMTNATRPGGAPTLQASTVAGPSLGWGGQTTFTLPASRGQAFVNGTAGGIAFFRSGAAPYVILSGQGTYSPAFSMSIRWAR
jgi:hypothetical protein